jgi:undecaprenyl diphosphate synthase
LQVVQEAIITGQDQDESDVRAQEALRAHGELPRHIAVIMDGNGRWACSRGQDRVIGHHEGVISVRDVTEACVQLGVEYLTLYTFSTENWNRPSSEVDALMQLLIHTIRREVETLKRNRVRLQAIGDLSMLPDACRDELFDAINATHENARMTLTLALSYSGRSEIVRAVRTLAQRVASGELPLEQLDEDAFARSLDTHGMPDPDLLIRTGGEYRVSNFLLWQLAYTEMYITDEFWPAFRRTQLYEAIRDFQSRDRRFGRVSS